MELKNHDLVADIPSDGMVTFEKKPVYNLDGSQVDGLYNAWITLNNPKQFNSYTTSMVKQVILNFRKASNSRDVVAAVFTGAGDKAFCTGGNTKEYAEYYAGRPEEYRQYMRLFNDMVTTILHCDKPVICRVNGMRIAGGQEIGMACDFTIASDLANFGQAGPRHGSVADGGSTDFLPLFVGVERGMASCTLCEPWSSYMAARVGLIQEAVPTLNVDGTFVPNPMVVTDKWVEKWAGCLWQLQNRRRGQEPASSCSSQVRQTWLPWMQRSICWPPSCSIRSQVASPRVLNRCANTSCYIGTKTVKPTEPGWVST